MMIGRRALWTIYLVLLVAIFIGASVDLRTDPDLHGPYGYADAAIRSVMFLMIALVVDRTTLALRNSLADARDHARQLAAGNRRLQAEMEARARTQEQLIHSRKIDAVGKLVGGVSHDFNHLLTLILGYAERARHARDADELGTSLDGITAAGRRAAGLSDKLLQFSRPEATTIQTFDLRALVEDSRPMLQQALGGRIVLSIVLPQRPCPVAFDREQCLLILLNIAVNAAHAMPDGGRFEIRIDADDESRHVDAWLRDTGTGMSAEILAQIFDPFFTTKPAGLGIGLGLPMARDLINGHGGSLEVSSRPGHGSCFHLRLPMAIASHGSGSLDAHVDAHVDAYPDPHADATDDARDAGAAHYQDRT
jgi:signal transduction histidine kinase